MATITTYNSRSKPQLSAYRYMYL